MEIHSPVELALEFNARYYLAKKENAKEDASVIYHRVLTDLFIENRVHFECNSGDFKRDLGLFQKILNETKANNRNVKEDIVKQKRSEFLKSKRLETKNPQSALGTKNREKEIQDEPLLFYGLHKKIKENFFIDQEGEKPQWGTSTKFSSLEEEIKALELNPDPYF